jgi:virginiamycin B lyase
MYNISRIWWAVVAALVLALQVVGPAPAETGTNPGQITTFPSGIGSGTWLTDITAGRDENMWFAASDGTLRQITPTGVVTDVPLVGPGDPEFLAQDPDGNVWFTDPGVEGIGRIDMFGHVVRFSDVVAGNLYLSGIAAGADGNMWFTEDGAVGRITPSGVVTEFPSGGEGWMIAAGVDGNMWFIRSDRLISRVTTGVSPAQPHPVLSGSGQAGLPLVCAAEVWGPKATVTVSWERDGATIPGETGIAYTPTTADVGSAVTCTSHGRLWGTLVTQSAVSNSITIVPQLTGPAGSPGAPGPAGAPGVAGPAGPPGENGVAVLAAVWAPGAKSVKAGKKLKVQYAVTNAASLQARLSGKKKLTKRVNAKALSKNLNAKAGTNTLKWKMPKALKAGKFTLKLYYQGTVKATTKVKVTK